MKPVKTLGLFAILLAVTGTAFGLFLNTASGDVLNVLEFGKTGVQAAGSLFIVFALMFIWQSLR